MEDGQKERKRERKREGRVLRFFRFRGSRANYAWPGTSIGGNRYRRCIYLLIKRNRLWPAGCIWTTDLSISDREAPRCFVNFIDSHFYYVSSR